ncbi:M64 family metallopeptidase [Agrilutibacter solisilvae]|uniref:FG-GAP repeat protein n=1 Tax=Agrilutibacter solisilvae TaxID=2763317 RepID=A0A974XWC7_9GAMM|nr:M64 family metallopeptidase [Lysobacter solisilvae]QSX77096.1 FG-GAP repeat protein [Lysobacter solisilvae]
MIKTLKRFKGLLALALCSVAALAQAAPGHYVVVRVDAQGRLTPVHLRAVELDAAHAHSLRPADAVRKRAAADASQLLATGAGWTQVVLSPERIRGEFAANGHAGRIQAVAVRPQYRSFVLRVPASAGNRITVDHQGRRSVIDLRQLAAQPALSAAPQARVLKSAGGPSDNRLDVVVVGEGYTASEQARFLADVAAFKATMFSTTPYKQYASFVNVVPLFVASSQSGADHPPYQAGCTTTSCCAETAAQTDPRAGTFVNTALDGRFCTAQIHRLVTVNDSKAYAAANVYPNWDALMVIVNDPVYGGSGGSLSTFSTHTSAGLIAVHEFGHSFTRLADEYESPYPGFPPCSDSTGPACERNVTNQVLATQVKWRHWFTPGNPIPTPPGTPGIGLFPGARYQSTGMYRPAHTCAMRELGVPFCAVCAEGYVAQLYSAWIGANSMPINLIEPGSEVPAASGPVYVVAGSRVTFTASILRPSPDTVRLQWVRQGVPIFGATGGSYTYVVPATGLARDSIRLSAHDESPLLSNMDAARSNRSREWDLHIRPNARGDFNGDSRSDIFWRNAGTGGNDMWRSASSALRQPTATVANLQWQVVGLGDFNGDGRDDVLWRNASTGANDIWLSGVATTRRPIAAETSVAWKVAGVGDFDADGYADIFWRNAGTGANGIWPAGDRTRSRAATGLPDLNWRVAGVGDFDADGMDDVLWRNAATGKHEVWPSGNAAQRQPLTGEMSSAWVVAGVGHFDEDHRSDILWRNTVTGANVIWGAGDVWNQRLLTSVADPNWKVAMVGDFDGDGIADIFWRHAVTGSNEMWRSGLSSQRSVLAKVSDTRWAVTP